MIDNFRPRVVISPQPVPPTPPTPTENLIYNWDLTNSLVDTVQGATLVTDGSISANGLSAGYFTFPITLLEPGYSVEIDFGTTSFTYTDVLDFIMVNTVDSIGFISDSPVTGNPWGFMCEQNVTQIIQNGTLDMFDNATFRLEITETENNNLIWTVLIDGTEVGSTPEYAEDGVTPFFTYTEPESEITADCQGWCDHAPETSDITALRIYQTSSNS